MDIRLLRGENFIKLSRCIGQKYINLYDTSGQNGILITLEDINTEILPKGVKHIKALDLSIGRSSLL